MPTRCREQSGGGVCRRQVRWAANLRKRRLSMQKNLCARKSGVRRTVPFMRDVVWRQRPGGSVERARDKVAWIPPVSQRALLASPRSDPYGGHPQFGIAYLTNRGNHYEP